MSDPLAEFSEKPNVNLLAEELKRSHTQSGVSTRITNIENTRYCRWTGQSDDGKKWQKNLVEGKTVFPWDGASDSRIFLADEHINSIVDLLYTSFWRAQSRVAPTEVGDLEKAATTTTLFNWLLTQQLFNELTSEVELLGQYMATYGWTAAHITWQQELGFKNVTVDAEGVLALAANSPQGSILADLPNLIPIPEAADQVAELLRGAFPELKKKRALKAVKDLRETGSCKFPIPTVVKNQPSVAALLPYDEFCFPPETTDIQKARVVFRRQMLTKVELKARAKAEGWDKDWVEQACSTQGKESTVNATLAAMTENALDRENLIEVVWAYTRQLDEDSVPGIYCTVFSPHVGDLAAKHELLDYAHGEYPFVVFRTESMHRKIVESRGVPEIVSTWQNELKVQRDAIVDYTSINTLPPYEVPKGRAGSLRIGPGAQLPVLRRGEVGFMEQPQREPSTAFEIIDRIETQADRYFGRPTEKVFPVLTQMRQQRMVSSWLHSWTLVFRQVLALTLDYMSPQEMERVVGRAVTLDGNPNFDITLKFDVRELSTDLMTEKLKAIAELVLPLDSAGVIDRAKLVELVTRAIDPTMAEQIIMQAGPAAQRLFEETNTDLISIAAGNPPKLRENEPTAQIRLQFMSQIYQSNPKYQQQMAEDPIFQQNLKKYAENLQFSVTQQQNAITGRLGVDPNAASA